MGPRDEHGDESGAERGADRGAERGDGRGADRGADRGDGRANAPENGHPLADLDRLVHEPARLMVLATLAVVESADATFLVRQTGLTWGNLSSHLGKLEDAGYVDVEKRFVDRRPRTLLSLTPAGRRALTSYRDCMRRVLEDVPE